MRIRQVFLLSIALGSVVGAVAALLFSLQQWSALEQAWAVKHDSRLLISALRLPEMLNMERAFMTPRLVNPGVATPQQLTLALQQTGLVDTALKQARYLARSPAERVELQRIESSLSTIRQDAFVAVSKPRNERASSVGSEYLARMFDIQRTTYDLATMIQQRVGTVSPGVGLATQLAVITWDVRDWSGRQTTMFISYVGQGLPLGGVMAETLAEFKGRIKQKWASARAVAVQLDRPTIEAALQAVEGGYWARGGEVYDAQVVPNRGRVLARDADDLVKEVRPILDSILLLRDAGMAEALRQADAAIQTFRMRFVAALGLVLLTFSTAIAASYWFDRRVVLPARLITKTILDLANGDRRVDVPLQHRSDELGQMARAIETLRGNALLAEAAGQEILALQQARAQEKARLLAELMQSHAELSALNLELESLAATDSLTGVPNRRSFDLVLGREWRRAQREETPIGLLLLDIDHFKSFNDRYGHPAGDACLIRVAAAIMGAVRRPGDLVARYGGEEFGVILPVTELEGATHVAEAIRLAVAGLEIVHADNPCGVVTVSVGVSTVRPQATSPDSFVEEADAALYAAKAAGRNRISASSADSAMLAL